MPAWRTSQTSIPRGNSGTKITLAEMSRLAADGARSPVVIGSAHDAVRGVSERDDAATMRALLWDVRRRMRYTNDPLDVELVKTPQAIVEECARSPNGKFVGDCDDASVLLSAMLGAVGIRSDFCVVPADRRRPGEWSHVYVRALLSNGQSVALDPIVRNFKMGDEVPSSALSGPRAYFPGSPGNGGSMRRNDRPYSGFAGIGAVDWSNVPGGNPAEKGTPNYDLARGGSGDSLDPTLAAVLGVTGSVASGYFASKTKPAKTVIRNTTAPASGGMDNSQKLLLVAGAVLVGGVVLMAMKRRR